MDVVSQKLYHQQLILHISNLAMYPLTYQISSKTKVMRLNSYLVVKFVYPQQDYLI